MDLFGVDVLLEPKAIIDHLSMSNVLHHRSHDHPSPIPSVYIHTISFIQTSIKQPSTRFFNFNFSEKNTVTVTLPENVLTNISFRKLMVRR